MHPRGSDRPRRTAALVASSGADEVVHLRAGSNPHIRRAARLASGNGVGLVLSGGGARGFAHLGVYRALVEAGVPIDAVGGCSIGAPLGAAIAGETPIGQMVDVVQRQFEHLLDYTLPVVSLVKGQRISASIEADDRGLGHRGSLAPVLLRVDQPDARRNWRCTGGGARRVPCGRASPFPESCPRFRWATICSSTAACSTTCRSRRCATTAGSTR